jgi:hypothetical protein
VNFAALKEPIPGIAEGNELIAGLDDCLLLGFARLGPTQHEALERLLGAFAGTPVASPLSDALAATKRSEFLVKHFCAIAAARAAIQGAQYDALSQRAAEAMGRKNSGTELAERPPVSPEGQHTALLSSTQQWLMEVALAGFKNLSAGTSSAFMATLERMQAEVKLTRLASLLTGFLTELLATPAGASEIPVFRWGDLWSRAMIAAQQLPSVEAPASVAGTFYPLGVDVRAHAHFASLVVYGVLQSGKTRRIVRVPLSSYKVDVIAQTELWQLFRPCADPLLEALAAQKSLEISAMQIFPSGDLVWTGSAKPGSPFDAVEIGRLANAGEANGLPPQPALSRHPVQLGELICLEKCEVRPAAEPGQFGRTGEDGASLEVVMNGTTLPLATERLGSSSELDFKTLTAAAAMVGLLRFDRGGWAVQPLCVRGKVGKKEVVVATGSKALEFCKKDKSKTLATLSERTSKLLRK